MNSTINIKPLIFVFFFFISFFLLFTAWGQHHIQATQQKGCAPFTATFSTDIKSVEEYHWQFGTDHESTIERPTMLFEEPGEYDVKLTVKYQNQSIEIFEYPNFIQVNEKPDPNFTTEKDFFCYGDTVRFANISQNANSYIWDFGDGINSDQANPSHRYNDPGIYDVTLIAFNDANCSNIIVMEHKIQVRDELVADFSASKNNICENDPAITFVPVEDHLLYLWDFGDGTTSNEKNPVHIFSDQQRYEVSLKVEDLNGCVSQATKNNLFTFRKLQVLDIQLSDTVICNNQAVTFTDNTKNTKTIQWKIDTFLQANKREFDYLFTKSGFYDLSITHEDNNGCIQEVEMPEKIKVLESDSVKIDISESYGCTPLTVDFSNNTTNAEGYYWEIGDQIIKKQNFELTFTEEGVIPIKAVTFHNSGCRSVFTVDSAITIRKPKITAGVTRRSGCVPLETAFSLSSENFKDVRWDFGDGQFSGQVTDTIVYSEPGLYEVSVSYTTKDGCKGNLVLEKKIHVFDTIISYEPPETTTICAFEEVRFSGELGYGSWEWDFGDGATSSEMNPVHQFITPGTHKVKVKTKNSHGCQVTIENYNEITVNKVDPVDFDYVVNSCDDAFTTFHALGDENLSYQWSFSNKSTEIGMTAKRYFEKEGYYPVGLVAMDRHGCRGIKIKSVLITYDDCINITLNPGGDAELILPPKASPKKENTNTIEVCSAPFEMSFYNPNEHAKGWLWDFNDGTTSQEADPIHTFQHPGEYPVDLYVYDVNGMIDTLNNFIIVDIKDQKVDFTYATTPLCDGERVMFTDLSENANTWVWNMGDNTYVVEQNPEKKFLSQGIFQVELVAIDNKGCTKRTVHNVAIGNPYQNLDIPSELCTDEVMTIQHNVSGFESYLWDLGDGQVVEGKNPEVTYLSEGAFTIDLEVSDENGCLKKFTGLMEVNVESPKALFKVDGDSVGCGSLVTRFINQSTDVDSCIWDFGNGQLSSDFHPEAEFSSGRYTVSLTVYKGNCSDTYVKENAIVVHELEANYSFRQDDICFPVTVQFEDKSVHASTWHWDFGDGNQSTLQNPLHIYSKKPKKDIVLTIKDNNGCTSKYKGSPPEFYITEFSVDKSSGCIPFDVSFIDETAGSIDRFWDFGDGQTSSMPNPEITYQNEGIYDVQLVTTSTTGCKDTLKMKELLKVGHIQNSFSVDFPQSLCSPLITTFKNTSIGVDTYLWDFGDGSTSSTENPVHVYTKVGLFDVILITENELGCSDTIKYEKLVKTLGPQASFLLSDSTLCHPQEFYVDDLSVSAISWQWHWGDGNTSKERNPKHQYGQPGTYDVTLLATDQYGCQELVKYESMEVIETPKAQFEIPGNDYCMPAEIQVNNLSTNLQNAIFFWDNGGVPLTEDENSMLKFDKPGSYAIRLTVVNQETCSDTYALDDPIFVRDTFLLKEPHIFQLSVTSDNEIFIKSNAYTKNNFIYNIIYRQSENENVYQVVDTVYNPLTTEFKDQQVDAGEMNYSYKIQSHVYCNNPVALEELKTYRSIHLQPEVLDSSIFLTWSQYLGHDFEKYVLLRKNELGIWEEVSDLTKTKTSFNDIEHLCPSEYEYKIIANNLGGLPFHSISNIVKTQPKLNIFKDQKVHVVRSTVLDNSAILTEWLPPKIGSNKVVHYQVLKSSNSTDFQVTSIIPRGAHNFIDRDVHVDRETYNYRISAINTCDVTGLQSNEGNSVLLQKQTDEYLNIIRWNPYIGWSDGVGEYLLQKKQANGTWETIDILPAGTNTYQIDLSEDQ